MTRLGLAWLCAGALAGCGGGNHVDGTIHGTSFPAATAISAQVTQSQTGIVTGSAVILLSSEGDVCSVITGGHAPRGSQSLVIGLTDVDMATGKITAPTAAGTYTVVANNGALQAHTAGVGYVSLDQTCGKAATAAAVGGSVTLTSAGSGGYAGSFDVTLDSGDHLSGQFSSSSCAAFGAEVSAMTDLPCAP